MTRHRIAAAAAGVVTALLLQGTVVGPALAPAFASLPAVLVAAVALVDGPATGLAFGFVTGLVADLASRHPAGVLALCWLVLGLVCGALADRNGLLRDTVTAGAVTAAAGVSAEVLLVVIHAGGTLHQVLTDAPVTFAADLVLALPLVALIRRMLRTPTLRAPQPVVTEFAVGPPRG
jgi:cell shape-determining protein MreD